MSNDAGTLRARVAADLPWHPDRTLRGILRLTPEALVLARLGLDAQPITIPVLTIARASVETGFGVTPILLVWHSVSGKEVRSRFEFVLDDDAAMPQTPGLAERVAPGLARDAAQKLEGGLRALAGGLNQGKRVARQTVESVTRQDEYQAWSTAIAAAQAEARRRGHETTPPSDARSQATTPAAPPPPIVPFTAVPPDGSPAARYAWLRDTVLPWLEACGVRARALKVRDLPAIQRAYPLDSPVLRVVVLGEFSRGKSTVINAVFGIHGEIALPAGMTPTTPLACAIRVPNLGETDGAIITYRTGRPATQLSLDAFRAQVRLAEEGGATGDATTQQLHLDEAQRVEVRITGAYLPAGVEIEDTPGLNETAARSAAALAALGRADLVLFVLAADQLLGDLERDVIARMVQEHHRNVLFLVNFWDTIDDEAERDVLRQRVATLLGDFPTPFTAADAAALPHVAYISALQAARAQRQRKPAPEESGVPQLRAQLRDLLGLQSTALLLRARSGRALRYLRLLRRAVSQAGAVAVTGTESEGGQRQEALTAALRALDGLQGAVAGAMARPLSSLGTFDSPALAHLAGLLGGREASPSELQDLRRILLVELRQAAATCAGAAQQAVDLVLAQARAAFTARSLAAPELSAHLDPPVLAVPPDADIAALRTALSGAAGIIEAAISERAGTLLVGLSAALREAAGPAAPPPDAVATEARVQALRALEDDILRLERLLQGVLWN